MAQERGKESVQQHNVEDQGKKIVKVQTPNKKEAALRAFPPAFRPNNKVKVYSGNEISLQNKYVSSDPNYKGKHRGKNATRFYPTTSNLNPKGRSYKGKEVAPQNSIKLIDLNKQENTYNGINLAAMHTPSSILDLTRNEATYGSKQATDGIRAPIFDLNQRLVSY